MRQPITSIEIAIYNFDAFDAVIVSVYRNEDAKTMRAYSWHSKKRAESLLRRARQIQDALFEKIEFKES